MFTRGYPISLPLHYLFYSWSFHRAWTKTLAAPDEPRFRSSVIPCLEWDRLFASTFPRRLPKYRWISYVNIFIYIYTGWGPSSLAKLVQITIITIVYDTQITIFRWVYKPTYNWGPHPVYIYEDIHHTFLGSPIARCVWHKNFAAQVYLLRSRDELLPGSQLASGASMSWR